MVMLGCAANGWSAITRSFTDSVPTGYISKLSVFTPSGKFASTMSVWPFIRLSNNAGLVSTSIVIFVLGAVCFKH